jgi:hypothetical protein
MVKQHQQNSVMRSVAPTYEAAHKHEAVGKLHLPTVRADQAEARHKTVCGAAAAAAAV